MTIWEFIAKWGWPILWVVFGLTLFDAWHDHRELSERIATEQGEERSWSIRRRILKWTIPILALIGAIVAQIGADLSDKKLTELEIKTGPRVLTQEQKDILQKELEGSSDTVYFVIDPTAPDATPYVESLFHTLNAIGYLTVNQVKEMNPTQLDVTIEPNDLPAVIKMKAAFTKAHIKVRDGPAYDAGIGNTITPPPGAILLTVGARSVEE